MLSIETQDKILRDGLAALKVDIRRRFMRSVVKTGFEALALNGVNANSLSRQIDSKEFVAPSFDLFFDMIFEHMRQSTLAKGRRRNLKESDLIDFFHAAHLPYVDLLRADGYCGNLIQTTSPSLSNRVVPKLTQLKEAIEKALSK